MTVIDCSCWSSTRRPSFDNAESGLTTCERHVVGHYRLSEALEGERADLFGCDASPERDIDALTEQNLAVLGLGTKTGGDIAHRADRRVAGALGEPDLAQRRVALRNTGAKAQVATTLAPGGDQRAGRLAHRYCHLDRALRRVRTGDWVVEEHHDPVARELVERPLELGNEGSQCAMVFA